MQKTRKVDNQLQELEKSQREVELVVICPFFFVFLPVCYLVIYNFIVQLSHRGDSGGIAASDFAMLKQLVSNLSYKVLLIIDFNSLMPVITIYI